MGNELRLDLGITDSTAEMKVVGYYTPSAKVTESGLVFKTYYGLRQFYVTGGFDLRLLTLEDPKEILALSRSWKWEHVSDLRLKLMSALVSNVRIHHAEVAHIQSEWEIQWTGDRLNKQELAWLEIVQSVFGCK